MNGVQITYSILIALLFAWRGPSYGLWVLLGNFSATLLVCLGMDLGAVGRSDATVYMMLIDVASGAVLIQRPGSPRIAAVGYAITVPIYSATILWGVSENTTFAVICAVLFAQLGVFGIAGNGGNGRGSRRRFDHRLGAVLPSGGTKSLVRVSVPLVSRNDGADQ